MNIKRTKATAEWKKTLSDRIPVQTSAGMVVHLGPSTQQVG